MALWDPGQYLKFADERTRPARELLARVPLESPGTIYDLGCGPGNSTALLAARWPTAQLVGVDSSTEMLAKARAQRPDIEWCQVDLAAWVPPAPAEVLYSNAALHWLPDHGALFPKLALALAPGGALAVQMPRNFGEPSHVAMAEAAAAGPWRAKAEAAIGRRPLHPVAAYYDWLAPHVRAVDLWETTYLHVLAGDDPVVEWTKGTALRPVLAALDDNERAGFLADYAARLRRAYPKRADGKTLFPFRRLFVVAVR